MDEDPHKIATQKDEKAPQPPLVTPEKIGPYKIEGLLTHGGMSYIYIAKHPTTGETVVVKVVRNKYLKDKEMLTRLLNEAKVIGLTNHPGIVKLYDLGQWEKGLFVAMEFVQGVSLRMFLAKNPISHRRALEIVLQIAHALVHLHSHGVIHRDLKPDNVLIVESGDIKLIDFGIAQFLNAPEEEKITRVKSKMGTPNYMSPEQRENPEIVSYCSDIFSLGIIAYELYVGRFCHGVMRMDLLPRGLRVILEKALKSDPKERYQDVVDFITDLSSYMKTMDEKEAEIPSDQMFQWIQKTQELLFPRKAPKWPSIEIGIAMKEGTSLTGLYLDFLSFNVNQHAILIGEPIDAQIDALTKASVLRGMVRAAALKAADPHPVRIFEVLNRLLSDDPMKETFSIGCLFIDTSKDLLSFAACQGSSLFHFREQNPDPRILSTPNPTLGSDPNATFLESEDRWEQGSTLILSSFEFASYPEMGEDLLLSPQALAEKALGRLLAGKRPPKSAALVSIVRV